MPIPDQLENVKEMISSGRNNSLNVEKMKSIHNNVNTVVMQNILLRAVYL